MRGEAAKAECAGCHYRFPKPEMHQVSWVEGGGYSGNTTTQYYNRYGMRGGRSVRPGRIRRGRQKQAWYCDECYQKVLKERWITFFVCLAILAGLFLALRWK